MSGGEFSYKLRVYIEDTDAGGIVYYVNYLKFMERARTEFMRAAGFGKQGIFNGDLMFVVRDVDVQYREPAVLDDELEVSASIVTLGGASMCLQQTVRRGGVMLADGKITIACVSRDALKPQRMPREMITALRATQGVGN
ncbi:MAG: tol-pal system-associated acyl-CoA thioesterase [Halioglobus sp.]